MNFRRSDGLPQATASAASFVAYVRSRSRAMDGSVARHPLGLLGERYAAAAGLAQPVGEIGVAGAVEPIHLTIRLFCSASAASRSEVSTRPPRPVRSRR